MTIAKDAGYRSMTTFNKAFKSITGKTPRDYRFNNSE
jgi:AraC-like DNA-binding protein